MTRRRDSARALVPLSGRSGGTRSKSVHGSQCGSPGLWLSSQRANPGLRALCTQTLARKKVPLPIHPESTRCLWNCPAGPLASWTRGLMRATRACSGGPERPRLQPGGSPQLRETHLVLVAGDLQMELINSRLTCLNSRDRISPLVSLNDGL